MSQDDETPAWLRLVHRRALADRLSQEMARTRPTLFAQNGLLASTAVQVTLTSAPEVRAVLRDAVVVAAEGHAGRVESRSGDGGLVILVHGREWSLIFPLVPFTGLMLVCIDDLADHCMQIYDDSEEARTAMRGVHDAVVLRMKEQLPIANLDAHRS